jgi:hypothetical protein
MGRSEGPAETRIEASGAARRFWVCSASEESKRSGRPMASQAIATREPNGKPLGSRLIVLSVAWRARARSVRQRSA